MTTDTPADAPKVVAPVKAPAAVAETPAAEPATMSADTFCRLESQKDKRVELLTAFHRRCIRDGIVSDTRAGFEARYAAFANKKS